MANIDTLNEFLRTLNDPAYANHHNVSHLMTLFCADDTTLGFPFVGITQRGPQFKLKANIKKLFLQLLTISFHDMAWSPAAPLRLTDGDTIAVEIDVTATHVREWFTDSFRSPPLSQIDQAAINRLGASKKTMDIPACAVFTFDGRSLIKQLAIYMDRYRMMHQLAPAHWTYIELPNAGRASSTKAGGRRITITVENR